MVPVTSAAAPAAPAIVRIPAASFSLKSTTTYTIDPAASAVHVAIDATIKNNTPNQTVGSTIYQTYLPRLNLIVVAEAANLAASKSTGSSLGVRLDDTEVPIFKYASVDLSPDLYYPQSQTVRLTYDIPTSTPRTESVTRVNSAFATFPMLAEGDANQVNISVVAPKDFEIDFIGDTLVRTEQATTVTWSATAIPDPDTWFVFVDARNDDGLLHKPVTVGDETVDVRAWPGDTEWEAFVVDHIERGLARLEELIGLPWPKGVTLDVIETVSPYLYGYAGWYRPRDEVIEIGDELEAIVIVHELSHLWFMDDLFTDRWIDEGLAQAYAAEVLRNLGEDADLPVAALPTDPGHIPLSEWGTPDIRSQDAAATEAYGYNAAYVVMSQVTAELGFEKFREVLAKAADATLPYTGDPEPEKTSVAKSWRLLLDLLENVGGSTKAEQLFRDYVIADAGTSLDVRTASRAKYDELVARGGEWSPPYAVRGLMSHWQFNEADDAMEETNAILDTRDAVAEQLDALGLDLPEKFETDYETAEELEDLATEADAFLGASKAVVHADHEVDKGHGVFGTVGMLFSSAPDDVSDAKEALTAGDIAEAKDKAASAERTVDAATTQGLIRSGVAVVVIGGGVLGRRGLRRRRRTPKHARRVPGTAAVEYFDVFQPWTTVDDYFPETAPEPSRQPSGSPTVPNTSGRE